MCNGFEILHGCYKKREHARRPLTPLKTELNSISALRIISGVTISSLASATVSDLASASAVLTAAACTVCGASLPGGGSSCRHDTKCNDQLNIKRNFIIPYRNCQRIVHSKACEKHKDQKGHANYTIDSNHLFFLCLPSFELC